MGSNRYNDDVLWLDNRRKQYDNVEAAIAESRKKDAMVDERIRRTLYLLLAGIVLDEYVATAELIGTNKIRVGITRPGTQKGLDTVVLTLSEHE